MASVVSAVDFCREVRDDVSSPTTSNFVSRMPQCRDTVNRIEEGLAQDREGLVKLKNAVKDIAKAGNTHATNEMELSKVLNRLGENAFMRDDEPDDIGAAFQKFAVLTKELSNLMKNMMQNLDSIVMFPVDRLLKTELRGSKGDLKRPFDRAWKDYNDKYNELERQKKKQAKEAGLHRSELTPGEIADEMEKERKFVQLTAAEYLIRVNEIKTKKGVNLLKQLLEYYKAQYKYFTEGLETMDHFGSYVEDLSVRLGHIQQDHESERKALVDVKNTLKNSPGFCKMTYEKYLHEAMMSATLQMVQRIRPRKLRDEQTSPSQNGTSTMMGQYTLHQAKGDASAGSRKTGYLNKRSEGRLRNVWQRRRCSVRDGLLEIFHADESKAPTQVGLLTCQMKPVADDRLCFDVVSFNRTYHFQAESEGEKEEWMSVLLNSKDGALAQAFADTGKASSANQGFLELQRTLVSFIRGMPGNDKCCDCGSVNDATWLSTNFGVIVCIECSGIHREMGVHITKIQSLTLDNIGTSQLLIARVMTNEAFNKVMEARASNSKLNPTSTMDERKAYIRAKYEEKRFVQPYCRNAQELYYDLEAAIDSHNIYDLLQCFGEAALHGVDFTDPLPNSEFAETCLHQAISHETGHSLHVVDFLVQNSSTLDRQTREGNTPLHYCVIQNQPESMRLLLRSGATPTVENNNGKTPVDIAKERGNNVCEEMLLHAIQRKKTMFENVNVDWHLSHEEGSTDFSDDEAGPDALNGSRAPDHLQHLSPDKTGNSDYTRSFQRGARPFSMHTPSRLSTQQAKSSEWLALDRSNDWPRAMDTSPPALSTQTSESPRSNARTPTALTTMLPPPPPNTKKPSMFSGSNLSMVGSLKKGSKQSLSLPSTSSYNTLPSPHHLRLAAAAAAVAATAASPAAAPSQSSHKRSPSSDSGHGTMHNPLYMGPSASSRSNTPVSYKSASRVPHTVFLHVGTQSGGNSDTSPPAKGFSEESSPESRESRGGVVVATRLHNGRSTESLDSLSDESAGGGRHRHNNRRLHHNNNNNNNSSGSNIIKKRNPVPPPRKRSDVSQLRRCRALYDCEADNEDELTFEEGDVIVITSEETEDENWMEGVLETDTSRRGLFPVSFVHMLQD